MSKVKHTPGVWEPLRHGIEVQSEDGRHEVFAYVGSIPVPVCEVHSSMFVEHDAPVGEYSMCEEEGLANLRLIAAAPELLEVLKWIGALVSRDGGADGTKLVAIGAKARAAIAKATGKE